MRSMSDNIFSHISPFERYGIGGSDGGEGDELGGKIPWPEEPGAFTCRQLTILRAVGEEPLHPSPMQHWGARLRRLFGRS